MSWFSNLFKSKEKETQPIVSPKIQTSTKPDNEIRLKVDRDALIMESKKQSDNPFVINPIVRDFQGKFINGHKALGKRDSKTGRFVKV